jgi:hypothetical protein
LGIPNDEDEEDRDFNLFILLVPFSSYRSAPIVLPILLPGVGTLRERGEGETRRGGDTGRNIEDGG